MPQMIELFHTTCPVSSQPCRHLAEQQHFCLVFHLQILVFLFEAWIFFVFSRYSFTNPPFMFLVPEQYSHLFYSITSFHSWTTCFICIEKWTVLKLQSFVFRSLSFHIVVTAFLVGFFGYQSTLFAWQNWKNIFNFSKQTNKRKQKPFPFFLQTHDPLWPLVFACF